MNVGVDFDHTLFDTNGFYDYVEDQLGQDILAVKEGVQRVVQEYGEYRLEKHAEQITASPEQLEEAYAAASRFLYNPAWIKEHGEEHNLVILTRDSHTGWQDVKVEAAGLYKNECVEGVRIVSGEETKYYADIDVLLDDTPREIREVETRGTPGIYVDRYGENALDGRGVPDLTAAAQKLLILAERDDS